MDKGEHTHTSLGGQKGKYYIGGDIQEDFNALYCKTLEGLQEGESLHITEKHRDISPFLIDLDFKQRVTNRLYTEEMLMKFLNALKNQINQYIVCENMTFYVLEKGFEARPDKKEGEYKDGLHIVVPDVVTKPDIQFIIRQNIINNDMENIFGSTFNNTYKDIYDESVIQRNNWFMYGSCKENEENAWAVTRVFDKDLGEIDCVHTDSELVDILSIRNKFDASEIKADKVEEVKEWKTKNEKPKKTDEEKQTITHTPTDCETIVKLVKMLNVERANDYHKWINVGACLYNINEDLLGLWEEFSKQSDKYTDSGDDSCESKWRTFGNSHNKTTEGALRYWAKQDNPEEYRKLQDEDIRQLIYNSRNETHYDVARVVYFMFKDRFVFCQVEKQQSWYEFKNHRWCEISMKATSLKKLISTEVFKAYSLQASYYHQLAYATDDDTQQSINNEIAKKLATIASKLKNDSYEKAVISQCEKLFCVSGKEFVDMLNENMYLIGFENGVYDLKKLEFREGQPTDLLTMSVGYDYIEEEDKEANAYIMKFFNDIMPNQDMVKYMITLIAYCLCGNKYREKVSFWVGKGGNGKGILATLLKKTFGEYIYEPHISIVTTLRKSASSATDEIAQAKGKRIMMLKEPSEGEKIQASTLKDLSGNDTIAGRALFKSGIQFEPQFHMILQMNNNPNIDFDGGVVRRYEPVWFNYEFKEAHEMDNTDPNHKLSDAQLKTRFKNDVRLHKEFMRILLSYYKSYVQGNKTIEIPKEIVDYKSECLEEINVVGRFIKEMYTRGTIQDMVDFKEMHNTFLTWNIDNVGQKSQKWFKEQLKFNNFEKSKDRIKGRGEFRDCYVVYKLKKNQEAFNDFNNSDCHIKDGDELD